MSTTTLWRQKMQSRRRSWINLIVAAVLTGLFIAPGWAQPVGPGGAGSASPTGFSGGSNTIIVSTSPSSSCIGLGGVSPMVGQACNNSGAWTVGTDGVSFNIYYGNQIRLAGSQATGAWHTAYKLSSAANVTIGTSGPGMYSGTTAGAGNGGGLAFQGTSADAANGAAAFFGNATSMAVGHDRYIMKFAPDNFSTVKAAVTTAGSIVYESSGADGMFDRVVASDVANATTSFADVTGLTWVAQANTTYRFDCYLFYTTTATTTGIKVALNGPASPTLVDMSLEYGGVTVGNAAAPSAAFYQAAHLVAYDTGSATTDAVATATSYPIVIHGVVVNGANAGTFAIRHASETANSTSIKQHSYCTVH